MIPWEVRSIANAVITECVEDRRDWNPGKNATEKPRNDTGFVYCHEDVLVEFTADSSLLDHIAAKIVVLIVRR